MKKKNLMTRIILGCLLITGCSEDPRDYVLPKNVNDWHTNATLKRKSSQLSEDERQLFNGYLERASLTPTPQPSPNEKPFTIRQALDKQKEFLFEKNKEDEKNKKTVDKINSTLSTSLLSLELIDDNSEPRQHVIPTPYFNAILDIKNIGTEDLTSVKGVMHLATDGGVEKTFYVSTNGIGAGQSQPYVTTFDYGDLVNRDDQITSVDFSQIKYKWTPKIYTFKSGSELLMPN